MDTWWLDNILKFSLFYVIDKIIYFIFRLLKSSRYEQLKWQLR